MVKVTKSGRIVDPKRPKRYLNSYILYFTTQRPSIVANNAGLAFGDAAKIAAVKWNKMAKGERAVYEEAAAKGRKQYFRRMARYKKPRQETLIRTYGFRPKRLVTSFAYFVKYNFGRASRGEPGLRFEDVVRKLAASWNEMAEEEKRWYEEKASLDRHRWLEEMHLYEEGAFRHEGAIIAINGKTGHCRCCGRMGRPIIKKNRKTKSKKN